MNSGLASARASAVRAGKRLAAGLNPGRLTYLNTVFPCSLGGLSFFSQLHPGGSGMNEFRRQMVTIAAEDCQGVTFASGGTVRLENLVTGFARDMEIASGNDAIGRDENFENSRGDVTLTLVAINQGV